MTTATAGWTPDRYEIREYPEGDIIAAIYDTMPSDWEPFFAMRPDPGDAEKRLLTNQKGQTTSVVLYEARRQQQRALNFLNDRFQVTEDRDGSRHLFRIEDRARRGPQGQVQNIAAAWRNPQDGWQADFTQKGVYSSETAAAQIHDLNQALNRRPSTPDAEAFAATYLREHPYPQAGAAG